MVRILKLLLWMALALGCGLFLATYEIQGDTIVHRVQRIWKRQGYLPKIGNKIEDLQNKAEDVWDAATDKLSCAAERNPNERHSADDRDAIKKLVAKRNGSG